MDLYFSVVVPGGVVHGGIPVVRAPILPILPMMARIPQGQGTSLLPLPGSIVQQPFLFVQPQAIRPLMNPPAEQVTGQQTRPQSKQGELIYTNQRGMQKNVDLDDEANFPPLTSGQGNPATTVEENLEKLKRDVISVLNNFPHGLKTSEIWKVYNSTYHHSPMASEYGVKKLKNVLEKFDPDVVEFTKNNIPFLGLKGQIPASGMSWGQGVQPGLSLGERSSSTSSVDSVGSSASGNMWGIPAKHQKPAFTTPNTGASFIDFTTSKPSTSSSVVSQSQNTGVIDLTNEKAGSVLNSNFISFSANSNAPPVADLSLRGQPRRAQQAAKPPPPLLIDLTDKVKPVSTREFEPPDIRVSGIRGYDGRRQPPKDVLENAARECVEILADANEFVSLWRVEDLLKRRFNTNDIRNLGIRYLENIDYMNEFNRAMSKVNAYIQAFVKVRSICTIYELNQCLAEYAPDKEDFASFKFGPLQRMPEVYRLFKFPTDMADIPEITSLHILEHLRNYMTMHNKWTERLVMEEFMNHLVGVYGVDNAYVLGIRLRSLPLAAMVTICEYCMGFPLF